MGEAWFYHMTRTPLETTLPVLLERALGAGWKVAVRGRDPGRLDWLDQKLWTVGDESFLPHGLAGGPHDADQPILLVPEDAPAAAADCVVSVDGAEISAGEVTSASRAMILFDGHDEAALARARDQWRALTGAGCAAKYWSQESGRWELKAENT